MQLHYGVKRDNNKAVFNKLGPDAGIDCINNFAPSSEMADYLNALAITDELPKTILYSLNQWIMQPLVQLLVVFKIQVTLERFNKVQRGGLMIIKQV